MSYKETSGEVQPNSGARAGHTTEVPIPRFRPNLMYTTTKALAKGQSMPFSRITACVTVEEQDADAVVEAIHTVLDGFVIRHMPVFDSEVSTVMVCEADHVPEVRRDANRL